METEKMQSIIESLLFASGDPISIDRIEKIANASRESVIAAIDGLMKKYRANDSGLVVLQKDDEIQMVTRPENAQFVEQMVSWELKGDLSKAALEVLSIIAYRGPIGRSSIEAIRGVNCSFTLRNLLIRGLIERIDNPLDNRSYLYRISFDFLKEIGVESVTLLPEYDILSKDERVNSVLDDPKASNESGSAE